MSGKERTLEPLKRFLFRLIYKPYSVEEAHLSRQVVTDLLMRSTRKSNEPSQLSFLFDLAPDGGYLAVLVTKHAGGLLHHLFNLTFGNAVCFCGPIQKLSPLQVLPGILLYGVRTFLTLGRARASNQPERINDSRIKSQCPLKSVWMKGSPSSLNLFGGFFFPNKLTIYQVWV